MTDPDGLKPRSVRQLAPGDHVVIVGAGPAGLTAAYELTKRSGARITVLEADHIVGGISRTVQYKGFRFDMGGHRFFTKIGPVERLWHEILGNEFIRVPRLSRIFYNGRYFDYPLRPMNALSGLGAWNAAMIVLSYLKWHYRPYPVEENFEQWVTNRFGRRLYLAFFRTYTEKVWGLPCSEIRAEWAAQRIQGLSLARAILNATALNKRSTEIKSLINEFEYPRLGPGQMWETCRDLVVARGHSVRLGHRVTRLDVSNNQVTSIACDTGNGEEVLPVDHVISSMPLRTLVRDLRPTPPPEVTAAAEGLTYREFLVVALMLRREHLFPDNWIYIHTPGVKVGRIQNFNNWSAAMVPVPGITCLGMEYFCFKGDGLWSSADADLAALAASELEQLGLARKEDVVDAKVVRVPKAYPIYDSAYRGHVDRIRTHLDDVTNLHTVGRNGMHKYNNQDHSMLTAIMTVDNMLGSSHDIWSVNTDYEYHEEQRVTESAEPVQG
ncbi:MAG: NAD(P)/FAD-dependent oxidoreductase [Vicinamibacterales bacterium]